MRDWCSDCSSFRPPFRLCHIYNIAPKPRQCHILFLRLQNLSLGLNELGDLLLDLLVIQAGQ